MGGGGGRFGTAFGAWVGVFGAAFRFAVWVRPEFWNTTAMPDSGCGSGSRRECTT